MLIRLEARGTRRSKKKMVCLGYPQWAPATTRFCILRISQAKKDRKCLSLSARRRAGLAETGPLTFSQARSHLLVGRRPHSLTIRRLAYSKLVTTYYWTHFEAADFLVRKSACNFLFFVVSTFSFLIRQSVEPCHRKKATNQGKSWSAHRQKVWWPHVWST